MKQYPSEIYLVEIPIPICPGTFAIANYSTYVCMYIVGHSTPSNVFQKLDGISCSKLETMSERNIMVLVHKHPVAKAKFDLHGQISRSKGEIGSNFVISYI